MMELTRTNSNKAEMIKNMSITFIPQSVNVYTISQSTVLLQPPDPLTWPPGVEKINSKDLSNRCISESTIKRNFCHHHLQESAHFAGSKEQPAEQRVILKFLLRRQPCYGLNCVFLLHIPWAHILKF